jgi:DNA-binding LacI/PurR family transcriptional regulator
MVGLLVPSTVAGFGLTRAVYLTLVHAVRQEVEARGYGLYVGTFSGTSDGELVGDRVIRERQIDGAVVARLRAEHELEPLRQAGLPVVILNRPTNLPGVHSVIVNNRAAAATAARHLLELGHRSIGVLAGPEDVYSAAERLLGYQDAVREAGLPSETLRVVRTDLAEEEGRLATATLLDHAARPTGLLAVNDELALAAAELASSRGLRLPEDFSIVGFDDIDSARYVKPALTTIHMPWDRMAQWGARVLLDAMGDPAVERVSVEMMTELMVRESTSVVRAHGSAGAVDARQVEVGA